MIRLDLFDNTKFDRGASRLVEVAWVFSKVLFFLPPFPLPSILRVAILRAFGAKIGSGVVIRSGVNITFPWRLEIGDNVWIGEHVFILSLAKVMIGAQTCISQRSFLCTGSHDFQTKTFDLIVKPISIGSGCWIAASSFVCPGIVMEDESMCAAGSVVTKSVSSGEIVGGNPAKQLQIYSQSNRSNEQES